jgi:Ca2+-transporting ATPase
MTPAKSSEGLDHLLGRHWHHLPSGEVIELLETNAEAGLDRFAVQRRQAEFGANQLTPRKGRSPWMRFLLQFHNPLIYILLAASGIKLAMGGWVDAGVILGVVLINAWIGYLQEAKAERAIEALSKSLVTESTVVRAGKTVRVPSTELVPGDVVLLASGDKVPADLRLVATRDLQVAEAALTGESTAVEKSAEASLERETPLADRVNMAYASDPGDLRPGPRVVVATGDHTEIGRNFREDLPPRRTSGNPPHAQDGRVQPQAPDPDSGDRGRGRGDRSVARGAGGGHASSAIALAGGGDPGKGCRRR